MKNLWIAFIAIATLGSIYPFDFRLSALDTETLRVFMATCCKLPGRGDLVGNVLLFLPFGFLGFLALRLARRPVRGIIILCLFGAIFALALQVLQFFLPSRDQSLQDVVQGRHVVAGVELGADLQRREVGEHGTDPWLRRAPRSAAFSKRGVLPVRLVVP